jgi:hypothetical protein
MKREVIDIGDTVLCDLCNADFTNSDAQGGFLCQSKGVCPNCADRFEASLKKYGEERYISDRALPGETFKQACLRWCGGNNTVTITSFDRDEMMLDENGNRSIFDDVDK